MYVYIYIYIYRDSVPSLARQVYAVNIYIYIYIYIYISGPSTFFCKARMCCAYMAMKGTSLSVSYSGSEILMPLYLPIIRVCMRIRHTCVYENQAYVYI